MVDSDAGFAAGREIWGYPKKFADITLPLQGESILGRVDRPRGNRICTAVMKPEVLVDLNRQIKPVLGLSLRIIPSPEEKGHCRV